MAGENAPAPGAVENPSETLLAFRPSGAIFIIMNHVENTAERLPGVMCTMKLSANWIWSDDSDGRAFNICSVFRRDFRLETLPAQATLRITADTVYRLRVNGQWLADGPCRAYPEHYRYDRIDLDGVLRIGVNRIEVEVWYYGAGTFQRVPQRAGLLAQLDCGDLRIITDGDWSSAPVGQWVSNTVKSSCQQV